MTNTSLPEKFSPERLVPDTMYASVGRAPSSAELFLPERVGLLYRLSGADTPLVLFAAAVAAFALWGMVDLMLLLAWAIWLSGGSVVRFVLSRVYRQMQPPPEKAANWENLYCLVAAGVGATWGATLLFLPPSRGSLQEMTITFLISSLSMGLPPSLAPSPKAFSSFILPIVVPMVALYFTQGGGLNTAVGLLTLVFAAVLLAMYLSAHRALVETLSLGRENALLLEKLRAAEKSLVAALAEQQLIFDTAAVGLAFVAEDKILRCNRQFSEIAGYAIDELLSQSMRLLHSSEEGWSGIHKALVEGLASSESVSVEHQLRRKDGQDLWVLLQARAVDRADPAKGSIVALHDISARKRAEAEVFSALQREKELNEMKSRFVSMASHEFRTPLSTILSSSEILQHYSNSIEPEERIEQLKMIQDAVRRMTQMINDVLVIGKKESGVLRFNPSEGDLQALCERIIGEVRAIDGAKHPIQFEYRHSRRTFQLDEVLLRHVFVNLLTNALKYSNPGHQVSLAVVQRDGQIAVEVSDQGIGIPEEDLPDLFMSFHRCSNVGERPGTGLGLSIVKAATELHRGRLEVHSRLGEGTRFTVLLPEV